MEGGVERPAGELRLKENRKRKIPARTRDKDSKQRLVSWLRSLTMCTGNHQRQHQKLGQKKESANRKEGKGRILRDVELLPLSEIQQIQAPFNLKVLNEPDELIPRDVKPPIPPRKPLQKGLCCSGFDYYSENTKILIFDTCNLRLLESTSASRINKMIISVKI